MAQLQCVGNTNGSLATTVITLSATTAGSTIIVPFVFQPGTPVTITSVKDSANNTYTQGLTTVLGGSTNVYGITFFYFQNVGAGVTSVTITLSGPCTVLAWAIEESGLLTSGGPFDTTAVPVAQKQASQTSVSSSNMAASTAANLTMYGMMFNGSGTSQSLTPTGGWSSAATHSGNTADGDDSIIMRRTVSATGTYAATGTCTSSTAELTMCIAFQQAAANTAALTGQRAAFTAGTEVPSSSVPMTGQRATFASGTEVPSSSVPLAGQGATFAPGAATPSNSVSISGQAASFTPGILKPNITVALTGVAAAFTAGNVSVSGNVTVALAGALATFTAGIVSVSGGTSPLTAFLTKWTPFRLAQTLYCLQQGALKVGNTQQNRANLLTLAIAQANTPSNPPWAKWRVNFQSRTSGAGLRINVPLVPGFVPSAGSNDSEV